MRHWGDADVLDLWNREFAYPRIVAAPQRDFFKYITGRFGESHPDAQGRRRGVLGRRGRRRCQDSRPHPRGAGAARRRGDLRERRALGFSLTCDSIRHRSTRHGTTSCWPTPTSGATPNSFRRPDSYRTREGEAAHRAWAEAAFQQTKDLRLVAMDKIAELVRPIGTAPSSSIPRAGRAPAFSTMSSSPAKRSRIRHRARRSRAVSCNRRTAITTSAASRPTCRRRATGSYAVSSRAGAGWRTRSRRIRGGRRSRPLGTRCSSTR